MKLQILTLLFTTSAAIATAVPPELPNTPAAIAEYKRIIDLAEAARAKDGNDTGSLEKRQCDRLNDPCCPDGSVSCVDDLCSFGDGINFFACVLGCCQACKDHTRYCNGSKPT
ncbi:hypothetical protein B0H67DRAFT_610741 [Lasiosphaeris hirsuta]|uniref:Uncharacterized protein n=1 Tax=Lasiosphaeris hirsuta TaxID=260670 RepID=A0AA40AHU7_9PEZI|nr:hypothetical protein B0H67DRAFT_610741 [Lasiosphaeris hirsuta]